MMLRRKKKKKLCCLFLAAVLMLCAAGCESPYGEMISKEQVKVLQEELQEAQGSEAVQDENAAAQAGAEESGTPITGKAGAPFWAEGAKLYFRCEDTYLSAYDGGEFQPLYIKGVNIGLGKPGYFPGETAITGEEYARWFQQIGKLGANCIRVYTVQPPSFYEAFFQYNQQAKQPLYLFHGTWYDEERMTESLDAFDPQLQEWLYQDMENLVNVIHGNCTIQEKRGHAFGSYRYDISPYVIGWILGIESEMELVNTTNEKHSELTSYEGEYIYTEKADPFEVFWAQTGDYIVSYEMEHYRMQRPVSYSNWPTADVLTHPSETMEMEDSIELNMELLHATEAFPSGLFASCHIYPYYPNFIYTQKEYGEYRDEKGNINTYKAYLKDLRSQHTMPMLVAEFGVPASRGRTHENPYTGFNQGNINETQQGEMLVSMMEDIYDTGYAGGLIFTWQDEWFKRTWNTTDYTEPERRAYWCDVMTCEQHFGLLEFVPGEPGKQVVLDGLAAEWTAEDILLERDEVTLSVKYDCAYLYLMLRKKTGNFEGESLLLPFDVTPNSGSRLYKETPLSRAADFVLTIEGTEQAQLLVQSYYDRYRFSNREKNYDKKVLLTEEMKQQNSTIFLPIEYLVERELILPDREKVFPLQRFCGGELTYGTNDYASPDYNSLADYYSRGNVMEIRIPWLLLNFRDPSTKCVEDDFWKLNDHGNLTVDGIWIGIGREGEAAPISMREYQWENWDFYPYFERLREGYGIVQKQFWTLKAVKEKAEK